MPLIRPGARDRLRNLADPEFYKKIVASKQETHGPKWHSRMNLSGYPRENQIRIRKQMMKDRVGHKSSIKEQIFGPAKRDYTDLLGKKSRGGNDR